MSEDGSTLFALVVRDWSTPGHRAEFLDHSLSEQRAVLVALRVPKLFAATSLTHSVLEGAILDRVSIEFPKADYIQGSIASIKTTPNNDISVRVHKSSHSPETGPSVLREDRFYLDLKSDFNTFWRHR